MKKSESNTQSVPQQLPDNFPSLVRTYGKKAYGFAFNLTRNDSDARDLVQEAFTRALKKIDSFDSSRPFQPWFFRIMKNIFLDWMRRYERKHTSSLEAATPWEGVSWEELLPSSERSPIEELEKREECELVRKALESLPNHYRATISLCDIDNYSYQEISAILDCPIGTIRSRIHQGRMLLRQAFNENLYRSGPVAGAPYRREKTLVAV